MRKIFRKSLAGLTSLALVATLLVGFGVSKEVKAAEAVILTDENGNDIVYKYQGEEYLAAQMDYTLGKILEKHID